MDRVAWFFFTLCLHDYPFKHQPPHSNRATPSGSGNCDGLRCQVFHVKSLLLWLKRAYSLVSCHAQKCVVPESKLEETFKAERLPFIFFQTVFCSTAPIMNKCLNSSTSLSLCDTVLCLKDVVSMESTRLHCFITQQDTNWNPETFSVVLGTGTVVVEQRVCLTFGLLKLEMDFIFVKVKQKVKRCKKKKKSNGGYCLTLHSDLNYHANQRNEWIIEKRVLWMVLAMLRTFDDRVGLYIVPLSSPW